MNSFINILIAEDNAVSREMMTGILKTQGYTIHGANDGDEAIKVIDDVNIDVALVDINMAPKGGFEFVKHLVVKGIDIPVVVITGDDSSDILTESSALGVLKVIQKPIEPDRLIETVRRVLERRGKNPSPLAVQTHETNHSHDVLMARVIDMAIKNQSTGKGGPFGALITDSEGKILGEGVNGRTSRMDPTAHAEVMAIRQAAEKLGGGDLSSCVLYCSSQPTMMGHALIESVGIEQVYFALTHDDIRHMRGGDDSQGKPHKKTEYKQLGRDEALDMFKNK